MEHSQKLEADSAVCVLTFARWGKVENIPAAVQMLEAYESELRASHRRRRVMSQSHEKINSKTVLRGQKNSLFCARRRRRGCSPHRTTHNTQQSDEC